MTVRQTRKLSVVSVRVLNMPLTLLSRLFDGIVSRNRVAGLRMFMVNKHLDSNVTEITETTTETIVLI